MQTIETRLQTDSILEVGRVISWREEKEDPAKKHQISELHMKHDIRSLILPAQNTYTQYEKDTLINKVAPNILIFIWSKPSLR